MKLYISPGAPSPRRVMMFMVEKNITGIDLVNVDLNAHEHKGQAYRAKSPLAKVPALELDDGRVLTETRAICTYLEGLHPEPNLMGKDFELRIPCATRIRAWRRWSSRNFRTSASRRHKRCARLRDGLTICWSASRGLPASASPLLTLLPFAPLNLPD